MSEDQQKTAVLTNAGTSTAPEATHPKNEISPELIAWGETVIQNMKRMATDEEYRKEVASRLP